MKKQFKSEGLLKSKEAQIKTAVIPILLVLSILVVLAIPQIIYDTPTPANNTITSNKSIELWTNITESNLQSVKFNWNGTNYSIFDQNLVLAYNFNNLSSLGENDTYVYDISGNGNNGTVTGATFNASGGKSNGNYDGAFEFDGIDDEIIINNSFSQVNGSFSMWIKADNIADSNYGRFFVEEEYGGFFFYQLPSNNELYYSFRNSSGNTLISGDLSITSILDWNHIFVSWNTTNIVIYHNGILQSSLSNSNDWSLSVTQIQVGGRSGRFFNGSIDEVRIWNKSLTASEVEQLYYSNLKKFDSDSWQLYVNQSLPSSTQVNTYFSCATNSSGSENCTETRTLTSGWTETITSNFSLSIGDIRNDFYGVNLQSEKLVSGNIDTDCDGTAETLRNYTWQQETFLNGKNKIVQIDSWLRTYYSGIYGFDFEDWVNTSFNSFGTYKEMPRGWLAGAESNSNATVYQTTDSHSGLYAIQLNWTGSGGQATLKRGDGIGEIKYKNNSFYNITYWAKGQGNLNPNIQRKEGIYPQCEGIGYFSLTETWTQYSMTCNFTGQHNLSQVSTVGYDNIPSSSVNYRITMDCKGNCTLDDFNISEDGVDITNSWWRKGNITNKITQMTWNYENNITTQSLLAYMPDFLANRSSDCIDNLTDTDTRDCMALNPQTWADIGLDYYKTVDAGRNFSTVEIWNEPDGGFFQDNLANSGAKPDFVTLFNITYNTFNDYNSNIKIVGYRGLSSSATTTSISAFTQMMLSNLTTKLNDGFSYHPYDYQGYIAGNLVSDEIAYLQTQCAIYGVDCSYILLDEWQPNYASRNESNAQAPRYSAELSMFYQDILNNYPSNVSSMYYHWEDSVSYFNCPSRYPEYPSIWSGVSEAGLDNPTPTYYPPYNVTKSFATYCPAGATVYTSTSTTTDLVSVSCKKGLMNSVIVINKGSEARNVTLNLEGYTDSSLIDFETGTSYSVTANSVNYGTLEQYGILYSGNKIYNNLNDLDYYTYSQFVEDDNFNYSSGSYDTTYLKIKNNGGLNEKTDIYNLTNSLIYYSNGSIAGNSDITLNDGNVNITLNPNNYSYVLDEFKLTEGTTRVNSPLGISSKTNTNLHITNTLSDTISGVPVTFTLPSCSNAGVITFTPDSQTNIQTFTKSQFTCNGNLVTLTLNNIEPSTSSNELDWTYGCNQTESALYSLIRILFILLIIITIYLIAKNFFTQEDINEGIMKYLLIAFITAILGLVFAESIANSIASFCPQN